MGLGPDRAKLLCDSGATVEILGQIKDVAPGNCVAFVILEDFNQATESIERFLGCGVLARREDVSRSVQCGSDLRLRNLQRPAEALKVLRLKRLRVGIAVEIV